MSIEVVRLPLSDEDWIEVKNELSYGEEQRLASAGLGKVAVSTLTPETETAEVGLDLENYNIRRLSMWLVDWSFCDENDKRVDLSPDAIGALDPATVTEIDDALTAHIEAVEAGKKVKTRKRASATKSAS